MSQSYLNWMLLSELLAIFCLAGLLTSQSYLNWMLLSEGAKVAPDTKQ